MSWLAGIKISKHIAWALAFCIYFSVLLVNDGFMALDEYWVGITRYIPAQNSTVMSLVGPDDVKSPLQLLPMHAVAQTALALGISSPYWQYRFVLLILGLVSTLVLGYAFKKFIDFEKLDEEKSVFLILMMAFYFAAPFGVTRPMFESIAAPWLSLAAVMAYIYDRSGDRKALLLGVTWASLSFVLRQQLGICALVLVILPLLKKQWKDFLWASGLGLFYFILSGIPDIFIRGKFHFSLLNLALYNVEHGSEYGNQSILFYPAMIFVIAFIPFFIRSYPKGMIRSSLRSYRSFYLFILLFLLLHSLFPNKWERFLISILPILVLILFPFLSYLHANFKENKFRLLGLYALNGFLFLIASFAPAQKNLIEMSRFLDAHPEIKRVHRVAETPGWITEAFILHKNFEFIESDRSQLAAENWRDCSAAFVVGEAQAEQFADFTQSLALRAEFHVNLIDHWAFKLNPQKNLRRVNLRIYSGCAETQ